MALNTWWDEDPAQRYWMEIRSADTTGRIGELLIAPRFPGAPPFYELVSRVRPGDRVLHWQGDSSGRALVGWSIAKAEPEVTAGYRWKPRGMSAREKGTDRTTDAWTVELGGFNPFDRPLTSALLRLKMEAVLDIRAALEAEHGRPVYFPYYPYAETSLRAQQGYFTTFPVQLFDLFPQLSAAKIAALPAEADGTTSPHGPTPRIQVEDDDVIEENTPGNKAPRGRTTRAQDPILRSAIENWAVDAAIDYYSDRGATDIVKLGKPYDIKLMLGGIERHVEVKGSSLQIDTVELTINEVTHAERHAATDLVVVDDIDWSRYEDGSVKCEGGRFRTWQNWTPSDSDLAPKRFAYLLPDEG